MCLKLLFLLPGSRKSYIPPILLPVFAGRHHHDAASGQAALKDAVMQDSILAMFGINYKMADQSIMEIHVYAIEAASIDGVSNLYLYSKICMPLSKPIISLIALPTFIGNWNDFFWA